jgi:hypothetical protein
MDKKVVIAVVVVVAIVAIAAVAVVLLNNNNGGNSSKDDSDLGCKLRVYGNANMDNYLDQKDLDFLRQIVDGKVVWDRNTYPLADADGDYYITENDYKLVQRFLNGEKCTMYYMDWDNARSSIDYPLLNVLNGGYGIHSMFSTGLDMGIILGFYDKFTYMSNGDIGPSDMDTTLYPNVDKMGVFNDMRLTADHYETFIKEKIKITLGDKRWYDDTFISAVEKNYSKYNLNIIKLPLNRAIADITWEDTMITLGVMCNLQDKSAPYIQYLEKVEKKIAEAVQKSSAGTKNYIMPYTAPGYDLNPMYVDARGTGTTVMADVITMEMLPLESAVSVTAADGFDEVEAEVIISYNPDVLIISSFGYASSKSMTVKEYTTHFDEIAKIFRTMGYKKPIYGIAFENCSMAGPAFILTLASKIWPSSFNESEAWDLMYEYYDKFTNFNGTLDDLKNSKFAVWQYSA